MRCRFVLRRFHSQLDPSISRRIMCWRKKIDSARQNTGKGRYRHRRKGISSHWLRNASKDFGGPMISPITDKVSAEPVFNPTIVPSPAAFDIPCTQNWERAIRDTEEMRNGWERTRDRSLTLHCIRSIVHRQCRELPHAKRLQKKNNQNFSLNTPKKIPDRSQIRRCRVDTIRDSVEKSLAGLFSAGRFDSKKKKTPTCCNWKCCNVPLSCRVREIPEGCLSKIDCKGIWRTRRKKSEESCM